MSQVPDNRKILFILDSIKQMENSLQNLRHEVLTLLPPSEKKPRKGSVIKKLFINGKERVLKY